MTSKLSEKDRKFYTFVHLTGASLAKVRDHCYKKGTTEKYLDDAGYKHASNNIMKNVRRSLKKKQQGNQATDYVIVPLAFNYQDVVWVKDGNDSFVFPDRRLTDEQFQSQLPHTASGSQPPLPSNPSSRRQNINQATMSRRDSTPRKTKFASNSRSHSLSVSPLRGGRKQSGTSTDDLTSLASKLSLKSAGIPTIDPDDPDFECVEIEDGIDNPSETFGKLYTFKVKRKDGSVWTAKGYLIATPLTGSDLHSDTFKTTAQIVQLQDGRKGVLFQIPQDSKRLVDDSLGIAAAAVGEFFKGEGPKKKKTTLIQIYDGFTETFTEKKKYAPHGGYTRSLVIVPPQKYVNDHEFDSDDEELEEEGVSIVRYGNNFFNNDEAGDAPDGNSLNCAVAMETEHFQWGNVNVAKTTAYAISLLALDGSEIQISCAKTEYMDKDVDVDALMAAYKKSKEDAASAILEEEDDEEEDEDGL